MEGLGLGLGLPAFTPGSSAKPGFDASEQREFTKALQQNLLVQTPLQVLLETMFTRLQSQAVMFHELQDRVEHLESKEVAAQQLALRVQIAESKVEELLSCKMPAEKQVEVTNRLDEVERRTAGLQPGSSAQGEGKPGASPTAQMVQQFESRLNELETRIGGMGLMGSEFGDGQYEDADGQALSVRPSSRAGALSTPPRTPRSPIDARASSSSPGHTVEAAMQQVLHQQEQLQDEHRRQEASSRAIADLQGKMHQMYRDHKALTGTVAAVSQDIALIKAAMEETQTSVASQLQLLTTASQRADKANEQLMQDVEALQSLVGSLSEAPRVEPAAFEALSSQVEAATQEVHSGAEALTLLRDTEIKTLSEAVAELLDAAKKADGTAVSLMETHQRLSSMETALEDMRNEVQVATSDALEGVARLSDLDDLSKELDDKASSSDIKQLAQQQAALAQSINGMAEWLAVRPETVEASKGATGPQPPSLTKFRCLTCDSEIKTKMTTSSLFAHSLKGGLLPKLDALNAPHPTLPGGPGLHVAELRKMATAPIYTNTRDSSGHGHLAGQDYADYGANDEPQRNRTTRTSDGRVALVMPTGGLKMPSGPRVPIFL